LLRVFIYLCDCLTEDFCKYFCWSTQTNILALSKGATPKHTYVQMNSVLGKMYQNSCQILTLLKKLTKIDLYISFNFCLPCRYSQKEHKKFENTIQDSLKFVPNLKAGFSFVCKTFFHIGKNALLMLQ